MGFLTKNHVEQLMQNQIIKTSHDTTITAKKIFSALALVSRYFHNRLAWRP